MPWVLAHLMPSVSASWTVPNFARPEATRVVPPTVTEPLHVIIPSGCRSMQVWLTVAGARSLGRSFLMNMPGSLAFAFMDPAEERTFSPPSWGSIADSD